METWSYSQSALDLPVHWIPAQLSVQDVPANALEVVGRATTKPSARHLSSPRRHIVHSSETNAKGFFSVKFLITLSRFIFYQIIYCYK